MSWETDAPDAVRIYLEALGQQDWEGLSETLADQVVRIGPYRDIVEGRTAYRDFLAGIVPKLKDYELRVERVSSSNDTAWVRLSETISDGSGGRLRTEEALLFELDADGKIARVEVFTQKSGPPDAATRSAAGRA